MRFEHPYLLFLELLPPVLAVVLFFVFRARRKALERFGQLSLMEKLSSASSPLGTVKALLLIISLFFLILALARPQFGMRLMEVQQKGADVVICVDVSSSMTAEDLKPSRLEKAKETLSALVAQLGGNRVGIVAFAGSAFWQCPLTFDISGANLFLQVMDANLIPLPGTAIGDALRLADKGLSKTATKSKAIVLLTDGEDHKSDPEGAAKLAASHGARIFTIGFGNPNGEPIPVRDEQGKFAGYKKNRRGEVVMSKMDEALLTKIATLSGGAYFQAQDGHVDLARLLDYLQGLDKAKASSRFHREYEDRYQYPLAAGLFLLIVALVLPENKRRGDATGAAKAKI